MFIDADTYDKLIIYYRQSNTDLYGVGDKFNMGSDRTSFII